MGHTPILHYSSTPTLRHHVIEEPANDVQVLARRIFIPYLQATGLRLFRVAGKQDANENFAKSRRFH